MQNVPNVPQNPYNNEEFEVFIKSVGEPGLKNWSITAEALGISRKTITRWKEHPRARLAIAKAIQETIEKMEDAGKNDWRMYREKLKMLGVNDKQELKHEMTTASDIDFVLDKLERTNYEEFAEEASKALLESESSKKETNPAL